MGRQVRRVPANWEHPRRADGQFQPMFNSTYEQALAEYERERVNFERRKAAGEPQLQGEDFEEWHGEPPDPDYYRPDWPEEQRTHYQMYETTSEGSPISPVMESQEELARWLHENGASFFGDITISEQEWLKIINGGVVTKQIAPGVETMS